VGGYPARHNFLISTVVTATTASVAKKPIEGYSVMVTFTFNTD
jgi:hypothetical protein